MKTEEFTRRELETRMRPMLKARCSVPEIARRLQLPVEEVYRARQRIKARDARERARYQLHRGLEIWGGVPVKPRL